MLLKNSVVRKGLIAFMIAVIMLNTFSGVLSTQAASTYGNPAFATGADPWVIYRDGFYYYCGSDGDRTIFIIKSPTLTDFNNGTRVNVFVAPSSGQNVKYNIWGPHLNYIQGKWYIYYCAQPVNDTTYQSMRMYVIQGDGDDPQGTYTDIGKLNLYAPGTDTWAIDGSVIERSDGTLYMTWSGITNFTTLQQNTYIAKMDSPTAITSSTAVVISTPSQSWEIQTRAIQEGQRPLYIDRNGKTIIVYSASASWTDNYCLGTLTNTDGNFLNASSWTKSSAAVFSKTSTVFGPGAASYVKSPDGTEDWMVYHAAKYSGAGWDRTIHTQKFTWNNDGSPNFGTPLQTGILASSPSGEETTTPMGWGNSSSGTTVNGSWSYDSDSVARCTAVGSVWPDWARTFRGDVRLTDYTVETDAKLMLKGTTAAYPKYGIYACYKDANNYVVACLDSTSAQLVTYAVVNGVAQSWQGTAISMTYTNFHKIKVVKSGTTFAFYIDGTLKQTRTFNISNGQIGLVTEDAKADFRNITVTNYGWYNSISGTAVNGTWVYYNNNSASVTSLGQASPNYAKTFIGTSYLINYSVSANTKLVTKGTTASKPKYGIYACYKDANNYVAAFLESTSKILTTYAVVGGVAQSWVNSSINMTYTSFHTIKVDKVGSTFKFYVDGTLYQTRTFSITDGQIGLVSEDAKADFKNVTVDNIGWGNSAVGASANGVMTYWSNNKIDADGLACVYPNWAKTFTGNINLSNYKVEADMKLVQKGTSVSYPKYGLYACYIDENNYVMVCFDQTSSMLVSYSVVGGVSGNWIGTTVTMDYYVNHTLKAEKIGSTFNFYVDNIFFQTRTDNLTAGQVGLVLEDAKAEYQNIKVTSY